MAARQTGFDPESNQKDLKQDQQIRSRFDESHI